MCKKLKGLHNRIDKCMKILIENLKVFLKNTDFKIVACCCGHKKYDMTIILEMPDILFKSKKKYIDIVHNKIIPRKRNFYKKDKQGFYFIPEVINHE